MYTSSGLHGYSHENPIAMTIEQQHAILDKTYKQLTEFCGKPPRGNVAPVIYISIAVLTLFGDPKGLDVFSLEHFATSRYFLIFNLSKKQC